MNLGLNSESLIMIRIAKQLGLPIWIDEKTELGEQTLAGLTKQISPLRSERQLYLSEMLATGILDNSALCVIFHPEDFCDPTQIRNIYASFLTEATEQDYWITTAKGLMKWLDARMNARWECNLINNWIYSIDIEPYFEFGFEVLNSEAVDGVVLNGVEFKSNQYFTLGG